MARTRSAAPDVIESCNSTWMFDGARKRFRRVPRGTALDIPAAAEDWEPYHSIEIDLDSGAFVVRLNESGTRLLRSFRHAQPCAECTDEGTEELSLDAISASDS